MSFFYHSDLCWNITILNQGLSLHFLPVNLLLLHTTNVLQVCFFPYFPQSIVCLPIYSLALISILLLNAALLFSNLSCSVLAFCMSLWEILLFCKFHHKKNLDLPSKWKTDLYRCSKIPYNRQEQQYFFATCCSQNQDTMSGPTSVWAWSAAGQMADLFRACPPFLWATKMCNIFTQTVLHKHCN